MSVENKNQPLPDEKMEKVVGGIYKTYECQMYADGEFSSYYDRGENNGCPRYFYNGGGWLDTIYIGYDAHHCRQCKNIMWIR